MPASHARKPSGQPSARLEDAHTLPSSSQPTTPTLLRLPSASSVASARSRGASNPSTPSLSASFTQPASIPPSSSTATSPSYFSPQHAASGKEARSPNPRRPPASFSGHGIDTSRGPPITLITRGNSDIARHSSQQPADFAFAQQQFAQLGLVSPGGGSRSSRRSQRRDDVSDTSEAAQQQQTQTTTTPTLSRQGSTRPARRPSHMASSFDASSEHTSGTGLHSNGDVVTPGTEGPAEDLFLTVAEDSASKSAAADAASRSDRVRSRIARTSNRLSFPSSLQSPQSQSQSNPSTPNTSRIPAAIDTRAGSQYRRASLLGSSSRTAREQTPVTPASPLETPRSRQQELSPKASFGARNRDAELSPRDFLAQLDVGRRRPSQPDATHTPPHRNSAYRPSNLHYYSSSRDNSHQVEPAQEPVSRVDGTESHGSSGAPTSVWDELDDLKTRIRRIEQGGKIPATSGAAVSQAMADRPRTANTSITTASSSPHQQRKPNPSPAESTVGVPTSSKVHPLLGDALATVKQHASPAVYRVLRDTASEALQLAEMTGSTGPQGTFHSASSILNGSSMPDRNVRRKADNICRSLTELCIALCEIEPSVASPAPRATALPSRRPSVQINGNSPTVRQSIEPESDTLPRPSPSTAMGRIEARRVSMLAGTSRGYGSPRETSQEPLTPTQLHTPAHAHAHPSRAGTSLYQTRRAANEDDEDPTLRAPSRAMTDFRSTRTTPRPQFGREYTSREPLPDLQPSPAIQPTTSLRRPTVTGRGNENNLLFRDSGRRYGLERQSSPAHEKQYSVDVAPRTQYNPNRNSIGGISGISRSVSLSRRQRGTSTVE